MNGADGTVLRGSGLHRLRRVDGPDGPCLRREWHPAAGEVLGADFAAEVAAQRLAAAHGLAPPVLEHDADARWMLMPWVEGRTLEPDWPQRPRRREAMLEVLARLRAVPAPGLPRLDLAARAATLHARLAAQRAETAAAMAAGLDAALDGRRSRPRLASCTAT